ncbi:MAG: GCN5-related N-acetyltransferase [candidate division CPR1 bacterium GW2011_GWA2_42_17]|uniref:GCN5-related N-acetyltransferase n=1 Tax=candidate division CPR1 bacterium GW2011_GWA2_42_17 TaxID=1618341 RepID=A0A0G1BYK3_9BACT|nr:MAG: GCN5-related N-acetyltransferase [candidate division CPR1 bacterium GW2011_GWA2_42_17]
MTPMKKILFLYPTNRKRTLESVRNGDSPDNELYGLNHFESLGWQASFVDVSPTWQNFLDKVFFPLGRLFRQQIDITFQLGRALLMLLEINRADVILTNTDSIGLPVCFLKRLGLVKPPVVYAVGLFYIQGKLKQVVDAGATTLFRRFYTWILSAVDHIVYHSPIEKEKLIKLGLYNPAKCTFVAMGSDGNFFRNIKRSDLAVSASAGGRQGRTLTDTPLVLAVGRDHARDYETLFAAALELPDVEFVVICSRRNIEGLTAPENVKILLDLPYREVARWYRKATVIVIPMKEMYRSSGQMTLTDAIQAGKPIIASDVIGISHYGLRNGITQTEKLAARFTTENYAMNIAEAVGWAVDPIRLRPINRADLEFIRRIRNENRQFFFDSNYISRQDQHKWFENYQNKVDDYMLILEDKRISVGMGAIYHIDKAKKQAEIGRFAVDKQFQGRGYGKLLMEKIERAAKMEIDLENIYLEVFGSNIGAVNLYLANGFTKSREKTHNDKLILLMVKSFCGKKE